MFTHRMKLLLVILSIGMISSDKFMSFDKFADQDDEIVNESVDETDDKQQMIRDFEETLAKVVGINFRCFGEILSLRSVIDNLKNGQFNIDVLYSAVRDFTGHFPGLKSSCGINLPKIDFITVTKDKFVNSGCPVLIGVLVSEAKDCVSGNFSTCGKVLPQITSVANCLKTIL